MEFWGYYLRAPDHDICRQIGITAAQPGLRGTFIACIEMSELCRRMDTGIGAAGAEEPDRMVGDKTGS